MKLCPNVTVMKPALGEDINKENQALLYFHFIAAQARLWKLQLAPFASVSFNDLYLLYDNITEIFINIGDERILNEYLLAYNNLSTDIRSTMTLLKVTSMEPGLNALYIAKCGEKTIFVDWQVTTEHWDEDFGGYRKSRFDEPEPWEHNLSNSVNCFERMEICRMYKSDIELNLQVMCATPGSIVKNIKFSGGYLSSYNFTEGASTRNWLESLEFDDISITDMMTLFSTLSKDLLSVDKLTFSGNCGFDGKSFSNLWFVWMRSASVGTLKIDCSFIAKSCAILFIVLKDYRKYYR